MPDTSQILEQAYDLINRGDLLAAQTLLQPHVDSNSTNPDIWWLYAHATEIPSEGRNALMKVVSLAPTYPGATELINQYDDLNHDQSIPYSVPNRGNNERTGRRSRRLPVLILLLLIVGIIAAVLLFNNQNSNSGTVANQPTQVTATIDTIVPTLSSQGAITTVDAPNPPTEMVVVPTETIVRDPITLMRIRLANTPLISGNSVTIQETLVGNTLRVAVCAPQTTSERQTLLDEMMENIGNQIDIIPENVDAIAVALINCDESTTIRTIAAPIPSVTEYVANESLFRDFQAQWVPIE